MWRRVWHSKDVGACVVVCVWLLCGCVCGCVCFFLFCTGKKKPVPPFSSLFFSLALSARLSFFPSLFLVGSLFLYSNDNETVWREGGGTDVVGAIVGVGVHASQGKIVCGYVRSDGNAFSFGPWLRVAAPLCHCVSLCLSVSVSLFLSHGRFLSFLFYSRKAPRQRVKRDAGTSILNSCKLCMV